MKRQELPLNCWLRAVPPVKRLRVEEITDARRAEMEESERRLQELKPSLSTEEPAPEFEFEQLDEDVEFKALFLRCYGTGWKTGYYDDPDKPARCPFDDPEQKEIWEQGVCDGFEAHCLIEPKRVIRDLDLRRAS